MKAPEFFGQNKSSSQGVTKGEPKLDNTFISAQASSYVLRALRRYPERLEELLQGIFDMLPTAKTEAILFMVSKLKGHSRDAFLDELGDDDESYGVANSIRRHLRLGKNRLHPQLRNLIFGYLSLAAQEHTGSQPSRLEANLAHLQQIFMLSDLEAGLFLFLYLMSTHLDSMKVFDNELCCAQPYGRKYLAAALGINLSTLARLLHGRLLQLGILRRDYIGLEDYFLYLLENPGLDPGAGGMFRKARLSTIPMEFHRVPATVTEHLCKMLQGKSKEPVHFLLYGAAGTGKTSYAKGLAKLAGLPTYEIISDEHNKGSGRRHAITTCLAMAKGGEGSLIIVDEADNLLNAGLRLFHDESWDKGWLNQMMDEPGARIIWITNSIDSMEGSVARRFAFSLSFRPLDLDQRRQAWQAVLRRHGVRRLVSAEQIGHLSQQYKISPGVMDLAVRQSKQGAGRDKDLFQQILTMALDSHLTLAQGGTLPRNRNRIESSYSPEGLNLDCDLPGLLKRLGNLDHRLRDGDLDVPLSMNLLFYGPPGTGKSELARYLGQHLGREVIVRRGSDLLSMYVGGTEKLIAEAFSDAEKEGAILVVDEADGFLFSRDKAMRSWETGQVNEFLTQMERFRGILVCTTNRLEDLDQASVRRFTEKIKIDFLRPDGNVVFYRRLLEPLAACPTEESIISALMNIHGLTPGDFRVVRDRYLWIESGDITPVDLVADLLKEAKIKRVASGTATVGF